MIKNIFELLVLTPATGDVVGLFPGVALWRGIKKAGKLYIAAKINLDFNAQQYLQYAR